MLAENERVMREEEVAMKEKDKRAQRPGDVLAELSSACKTYLPDQIKLAKRCDIFLEHPTAACKLAILCEEETPEDEAALQIQVFPFAISGPHTMRLLQCKAICILTCRHKHK